MNMKTSANDVSNQEILQELRALAKNVDERFDEIVETTNTFATDTERRLTQIEREQIRMRSNMVTKEYLDDKMGDLHSDLARYTKNEIQKAIR